MSLTVSKCNWQGILVDGLQSLRSFVRALAFPYGVDGANGCRLIGCSGSMQYMPSAPFTLSQQAWKTRDGQMGLLTSTIFIDRGKRRFHIPNSTHCLKQPPDNRSILRGWTRRRFPLRIGRDEQEELRLVDCRLSQIVRAIPNHHRHPFPSLLPHRTSRPGIGTVVAPTGRDP